MGAAALQGHFLLLFDREGRSQGSLPVFCCHYSSLLSDAVCSLIFVGAPAPCLACVGYLQSHEKDKLSNLTGIPFLKAPPKRPDVF